MAGLLRHLSPGRERRLAVGVISGVIAKALAFLLTLVSVPLTLHHLGPERYGIWVTMISILAWVSISDLGVANGLTPLLSAAFGKDRQDLAQGYVSAAVWSLTVMAGLVGSVSIVAWIWIDWGTVFNITDPGLEADVSRAMALALAIFLANLPLTIVHRVYLAYQRGLTANAWQMLAGVAGVVGIYVVTLLGGGLVQLVLGFSGARLMVAMVSAIWLFFRSMPELRPNSIPNLARARQVMSMGGMFFVNQIATLVVFQKDNVLITHYLGPEVAAPFSVTWQMFLYLNTVNILLAPYLGPALGEAFARGDTAWMRKSFRRYITATLAMAFPATFLLAYFYHSLLEIWVGSSMVTSVNTVIWMAIWTMLLSIQWPLITLLNCTGRLRVFTVVYGVAAMLNLGISVVLIQAVGVAGGIMASVATVSIFVLVPSILEARTVLKPKVTSFSTY